MSRDLIRDTRAEMNTVGGPEPAKPLSEEQLTFLKLTGALVIICVLALRVGTILNWAWVADGLGRSVIASLFSGFVNDARVLFPVGLMTGWLLLFVLDQTKRLQRWLAVIAYAALVGWLLFIENRWGETGWLEYWYFLFFGFLASILIGVIPKFFDSGKQREFPAAAIGLFVVTALLCAVAFLDVHILASDQVSVTDSTFLPPTSLSGTVFDAVALTGFVTLFGWFVLYSDYRAVAVLTTSQPLVLAVMAGLLDHTQREYSGTSTSGGAALSKAKRPINRERLPDSRIVDNLANQYFEFTYLPPNSSRWVYVSAAPVAIGDVGDATIEHVADTVRNRGAMQYAFWFLSKNTLPGSLRRSLTTRSGLLVDNVADADVLVFVMSVDDFEYEGDLTSTMDMSPPDDFTRFTRLCDSFGESRKKVIVIADAHKILELAEEDSVTTDDFIQFVRLNLFNVDSTYDIVPVTWVEQENSDLSNELIVGVNELREAIER